ncbi:MAG: hypothetical protein HS101_02025 [Planctomycetia bacterium]|nr:hypothetical protein [Planctomycetia bacterium]MCC7314208.1 hypothetical protein [Planctomycetota bacterium]OQZ07288.1 MAG: hypothetical protein B6D36_00645 [Planctomycetes bacterium UTPLA1]
MAQRRKERNRVSLIERKLAESGVKLDGRVLPQHNPVSATTIHGKPAVIFGSLFVAMGVFICLMVTGVIPSKTKSADAPPWVGVIAGSIFAIAGLWVVLHGLGGVLRQRWSRKMKLRYGDELWRSDHKWNEHCARDMQARGVRQMLFGMLFMILFAAPFNLVLYAGLKEGSAVGMVFGCVNLFVAVYTIAFFYRLARWMKYGTGQVRFRKCPYYLGEKLELDYVPARKLSNVTRLTCTLRCIREAYITTQSGNDTTTTIVSSALYEQTLDIAGDVAASSYDRSIALAFDVPADAPPTCLIEAPPTYWHLEISAETPGVNLNSSFLLPVYAPRAVRPAPTPPRPAPQPNANQLKAAIVEAVASRR